MNMKTLEELKEEYDDAKDFLNVTWEAVNVIDNSLQNAHKQYKEAQETVSKCADAYNFAKSKIILGNQND